MKTNNLTQEQKEERRKELKRAAQKRYYERNKAKVKENQKKYNYAKIYKGRIEEALEYINSVTFVNRKKLKRILKGGK